MKKILPDLKNIDLKSIDFKDKNTQTLILMALLCGILFISYLYFVLIPQVSSDINIIKKTFNIRKELKEATSLVSKKVSLSKKLEDYAQKVELYEKKLPAQQEIPSLLENLSKMARNANITIIGITPVTLKAVKEKKASIYEEIPILITARSGYHELGRFLSNLENGDRFMKVVDINIKANSTAPKKHDVELMVYTYVLSAE